MTDLIDALADLPGTAQTIPTLPAGPALTDGYLAKPVPGIIVDLPPRPVEAPLFDDFAFEAWWVEGFAAAIQSKALASVQLMLALALENGLDQ